MRPEHGLHHGPGDPPGPVPVQHRHPVHPDRPAVVPGDTGPDRFVPEPGQPGTSSGQDIPTRREGLPAPPGKPCGDREALDHHPFRVGEFVLPPGLGDLRGHRPGGDPRVLVRHGVRRHPGLQRGLQPGRHPGVRPERRPPVRAGRQRSRFPDHHRRRQGALAAVAGEVDRAVGVDQGEPAGVPLAEHGDQLRRQRGRVRGLPGELHLVGVAAVAAAADGDPARSGAGLPALDAGESQPLPGRVVIGQFEAIPRLHRPMLSAGSGPGSAAPTGPPAFLFGQFGGFAAHRAPVTPIHAPHARPAHLRAPSRAPDGCFSVNFRTPLPDCASSQPRRTD